MQATTRKRHDPRRDSTRIALIEAAEALFADLGVEAVSARQIGAAVGSLNTNVVNYHFGGKDALIEAVFHHRLPAIDDRRGELLSALESAGELTVQGLVEVFALPLLEQRDGKGRHSFARFLAALERSGMAAARGLVIDDYPHSRRVTELLIDLLPDHAWPEGSTRMRLVVSMLTTMLQIIDGDQNLSPEASRRLFGGAIAMAAAALVAVAPEGLT